MCLICEKYGISKSSYEAMIRAGVISTTFPGHEQIFVYYRECLKQSNGNSTDAITMVSDKIGVSERTVYRIIAEFS